MPEQNTNLSPDLQIGAVVLAAGESRRMGQPKMSLPWGQTTVIARVVEVLLTSGLTEISVVTGGWHEFVERSLNHLPVGTVFNPQYTNNDMAHSLNIGLATLNETIQAVLVVLGDQPQIEVETVQILIEVYRETGAQLIVPSYNHRRGHPWLVGRRLWTDLLLLQPPATLREFLNDHADQIHYVSLATASVLKDLDTPDEYERQRPQGPEA